jgi:hypothetical protein
MEQPQKCEIEASLRLAVRFLNTFARHVIERNASERAMVFHIARKLADCVEGWAYGLNVDVEYNRAVCKEPFCKCAKDLSGLNGHGKILPDIIVHRPGTNDFNLLMIEVKKGSSKAKREADLTKLASCKHVLGYRYAVFLEIDAERNLSSWQWVEATDKGKMDFAKSGPFEPLW